VSLVRHGSEKRKTLFSLAGRILLSRFCKDCPEKTEPSRAREARLHPGWSNFVINRRRYWRAEFNATSQSTWRLDNTLGCLVRKKKYIFEYLFVGLDVTSPKYVKARQYFGLSGSRKTIMEYLNAGQTWLPKVREGSTILWVVWFAENNFYVLTGITEVTKLQDPAVAKHVTHKLGFLFIRQHK